MKKDAIIKSTLILSILLNAILFSVINYTEPEIIEKEVIKEVTKTKKIYVDEFDNEIDEPTYNDEDYTYWYYSYSCIDGVRGYGTTKTTSKHFDYSYTFKDIRKTLENKYKKDYSFIRFETIFQINKDDHEFEEGQ
jgi:hypothetical protein